MQIGGAERFFGDQPETGTSLHLAHQMAQRGARQADEAGLRKHRRRNLGVAALGRQDQRTFGKARDQFSFSASRLVSSPSRVGTPRSTP